jgi:TPR repeat protein
MRLSLVSLFLFSLLPASLLATAQDLYIEATQEKDPNRKVTLLIQSAQGGYLDAQLVLATAYLTGTGVPLNKAQGKEWLDRAITSGQPKAQQAMAGYYASGFGDKVNLPQAVVWYEKAAAQNYAPAQAALGSIYFWDWKQDETKTIHQDIKRALEYLELAAQKNEPAARGNLGSIYLYGDGGMAKNPEKAFNHLLAAATAGYVPAYFDFAVMHYQGIYVKVDKTKAAAMLKRALQKGFRQMLTDSAAAGSVEAQNQLKVLEEMQRDLKVP